MKIAIHSCGIYDSFIMFFIESVTTMNNDILRITRAMDFAARKHINQRRKGEAAEPYLNHLSEVANLLAEATDGTDLDLVIAGLLHDTIEDQNVKREEIASEFGEVVASIVTEVTDDKSLEKTERKRQQIAKAPFKSPQAKALKIADKISNLRSILASPPANWSIERKREYFDWAKAVVDGCRGINARLDQTFDEAYARKP